MRIGIVVNKKKITGNEILTTVLLKTNSNKLRLFHMKKLIAMVTFASFKAPFIQLCKS